MLKCSPLLRGPGTQQDGLREAQAGYGRQDVRRLRSTFVPRMKYLDEEALLAAAGRGQSDVSSFLRTQRACKVRCDTRPALGKLAVIGTIEI